MKNLNELKVAELKVIAKEAGIALSYTQDGKRHTLTRHELIVAIEATQIAINTIVTEIIEVAPTTKLEVIETVVVNKEVVPVTKIELTKVLDGETVNLNTVVKESRTLLSTVNNSQQYKYAQQIISKTITAMQELADNNKRNKLLIPRIGKLINVIKGLLISHKAKGLITC